MKKWLYFCAVSMFALTGCDSIMEFAVKKAVEKKMEKEQELEAIKVFQPKPSDGNIGESAKYYVHKEIMDMTYSGSDKYVAGNQNIPLEKVQKIKVLKWFSGDIEIQMHDKSGVELSETAGNPLETYAQMHTAFRTDNELDIQTSEWVPSETLFVAYAQAGIHPNSNYQKKMTVSVPSQSKLTLDIDEIKDDLFFNHVTGLKEIEVESDSKVHGSIAATAVDIEAKNIDLKLTNATQCKIESDSKNETDKLNIELDKETMEHGCRISSHKAEIHLTIPNDILNKVYIKAPKENITSDVEIQWIDPNEEESFFSNIGNRKVVLRSNTAKIYVHTANSAQ